MTIETYVNKTTGERAQVQFDGFEFSVIFGDGIGKWKTVDCKRFTTVERHLKKRGFDLCPETINVYI